MKKSEFKEYLKTEILKMNEANIEVDSAEKAAEVAKEVPDADIKVTGENKIKMSEFKNYLRQEILREINEAEEEDVEVDAEMTDDPDAETFNFDEPTFGGEDDIDAITDELVKLAKQAKEAGQVELANQILNSAKFSAKTEFKKVEKEA
jgi:protein-tyrosine-phosphatase